MQDKRDIDFYCRSYAGFLEPELCDEYVRLYEETLRVDAEKQKRLSVCYRDDGTKFCGVCNCMRLNPQEYDRFDAVNNITIPRFVDVAEQYKKDTGITNRQWPKDYGWEEFRIKRFLIEGGGKDNNYMPNNYHGLEEHIDIYSYAHAKRFLCLMVYLNDDFEQGETVFPLFNAKVKPEKGMVFLFPPTWTYSHYGAPPIGPSPSGAKYFLMTHTNYIDKAKVNEWDGKSFRRDDAAREELLDKAPS